MYGKPLIDILFPEDAPKEHLMPKKKTTPGNVNLKARGLIGHLVPLTPAQRRLITAAAGLAGQRQGPWSALALEQAARQALTSAGVDPQTFFKDS